MSTDQSNQTTKRKYRDTEEKRRIVADYEASGMTQKEFCLQRDIPLATFCTWLRKHRHTSACAPSGLLPVRLLDEPVRNNSGAVVVVLADGVEIRLPETASLERIIHLIKSLRHGFPC